MERRSVEAIVRALNEAQVRYLIVGGLAVAAHGHLRITVDVDLVLDPDPEALGRAIAALETLGYRPRAPVPFAAFADADQRKEWAREKGMLVFSAHSPVHPVTEVDLFLEAPFNFDEAYAHALKMEVSPGLAATFVGLADLVAMKETAGRPQDMQDVSVLIDINGKPNSDE
jgi:hypothetical protein